MTTAKWRKGALNFSIFCKSSVVKPHLCNCLVWKTSVNCVSDLSRRDKRLLKFLKIIKFLLIDYRVCLRR